MTYLTFSRAVLLLVFASQIIPVRAQVHPPPSDRDLQSTDSLGEDLFLQSGSTGMVLVVVRDDQVFFRGYGETAPNSHQLPTRDSLLRLCSFTKIFTTDVLSKLVADRTVRLDDPLQRYAPTGTVVPRRVRLITLANMATHTSGLPRELANGPANTPHLTFPDYRTRWRWLPNQRLRTIPGTAALYSNITFDLLGDALQSAAHKQYAAVLAERTLNPLHMQHTTFFPNTEQCGHLLVSAHEDGPCTATEATAGSSGLYSTADDMTIWLKYLLRTGAPAQDASAQAIYVFPSDRKDRWRSRFRDLYRHQPLSSHGHLFGRNRWTGRHSLEPLQCCEQTSACGGRPASAPTPTVQTHSQT